MDQTTLKKIVSSTAAGKAMAEPLLNAYVHARYAVSRSYTKEREDRAALWLLKERFGLQPKDVRYFDIGANHYLRGNNSYLCYRCGGSGVLVEADPFLCEALAKKRPRDQVLNVAVSDVPDGGTLNFYVCSLPTRSTLDPNQAERLKQQGFAIEKEIPVESLCFSEIAARAGFIPDYLSIDVESYDLRVLQSIDFAKTPVKLILAEADEGMEEYMQSQGYRCMKHYSSNLLFIREDQES